MEKLFKTNGSFAEWVRDELWKRGLKLTTLGNQGNEWWIKYESEHSANVSVSGSLRCPNCNQELKIEMKEMTNSDILKAIKQ